jgi:hypothetical protein
LALASFQSAYPEPGGFRAHRPGSERRAANTTDGLIFLNLELSFFSNFPLRMDC